MEDSERSVSEFAVTFRRFMEAMVAEASAGPSPLFSRLHDHLGGDPTRLAVVAEEFDSFEQPNVQVALTDCISRQGRQGELVGVAAENKRFMALTLSDLLGRGGGRPRMAEGPVDYVNFQLADGETLSCVQFGLYLVRDGDVRLVVFVSGPSDRMGPHGKLRVEVMSVVPDHARDFLSELRGAMRRLNVYRGHVISLSPGQMGMGPQSLIAFHSLTAPRREDVVLPPGVLERIERHTITFADHAEELLAAGRSLKRGLLLYGAPGTGKTLTVMYLSGRMPERTVILTTGRGMGMVESVAQMARQLAPSMVVLEDVDLIAEQRGQPFMPTGPLLFELLNEMDGLRDDCDVIFVLTTNRPDILEPALAARPGRIDLAVELPLPDADGRRRLLQLYARGLDAAGITWETFVDRTDGVSPAYVKELLRKAALHAVEEGVAGTVADRHLEAAMAELAEGGRLAERLLGFRPATEPPGGPGAWPPSRPATGFPPDGGGSATSG